MNTSSSTPSFLIAIPAFNESARLPGFLQELGKAGLYAEPNAEFVVVDDGSEETQSMAMSAAVEETKKTFGAQLRFLRLPKNLGKGGAVYAAWDELGDARMLAFLDSDGAVPADEVLRLLRLASQHPQQALLASRVKMLGKKVERKLGRHLTGRIFATLVGLYIQEGIYDSQCGCKFVPAATYRNVRALLQEQGFIFDVELVAALLDSGCEIKEIPIDWRDIPGSKVRLMRDSIRMFQGILRIAERRKSWKLF